MEAAVTVGAVETGGEIEEDVVIEGPVVVVVVEEEEGVARELTQTMLVHFHRYDREKSWGKYEGDHLERRWGLPSASL